MRDSATFLYAASLGSARTSEVPERFILNRVHDVHPPGLRGQDMARPICSISDRFAQDPGRRYHAPGKQAKCFERDQRPTVNYFSIRKRYRLVTHFIVVRFLKRRMKAQLNA